MYDDETAWEGEIGYVHCLLTTLAEGTLGQIKLTSKETMPSLVDLAQGNPELKTWTTKLKFDYKTLDARRIVKQLLYLGGFRWYNPFKSRGLIESITAKDDTTFLYQIFCIDKMKARSGGIAVRVQVSKSREVKLPQ
jgi:hypothetical protein